MSSAARTRIGRDNFGDKLFAEIKDEWIVLSSSYGGLIVMDDNAYAALVKYVEAARVAA